MATEGSLMTNEAAVTQFTWLVEKIARGFARPGVELDDLTQDGYLGLFKAVRTWRQDGGATFKSWASLYIKKAICAAVGDAIDDQVTSLDETVDGVSMHELVGVAPTQELELAEHETNAVVRDGVKLLPAADRELLTLWASDGFTHEQIARSMGVTRRTATDRVTLSLARLCRLLQHRVSIGAPRAALVA